MAACVLLTALSLAMAGCKMFGKKSNSTPNSAPGAAGSAGYPTADRSGNQDRTAAPVGVNGLLAGQVISLSSRKPPPTTIQIISVQDGKETGGAPVTVKMDPVTADADGYFTIQNLQPGRQYQLIARSEDGGKKLAGVTWAVPPNPRITIRISEDFASRDIPEGSPPPSRQRAGRSQPNQSPASGDEKKSPAASIERPVIPSRLDVPSGGLPSDGAEIGIPIPAGNGTQPRTTIPFDPEKTVKDDTVATRNPNRTININGGPDPANTSIRPPVNPAPPAIDTGRAAVPSCSLSGKNLHNFALNDIEGKPWEYRHDRKGRLTLIDFWGTWCVPCQHAIPHLNDLQWRYGEWGLEVVGIAYEYGSAQQQAVNVRRVANRLRTNYRLLLGSGYDSDCPVRRQFQVRSYPSLFLIDEKGTIVWEARQGLRERELQELEFEIKKRLNVK
jgi:thiol-disulfide isomerase/thioredoxin